VEENKTKETSTANNQNKIEINKEILEKPNEKHYDILDKQIETFKVTLENRSENINCKPIEMILYLEELGEGSFGKVYKAYDYNLNSLVALKIFKHEYHTKNQLKVFKELELLSKLNGLKHKAFIKFHKAFELPDLNENGQDLALSMEYGLLTLEEALQMKKYKISEIVYILKYLIEGLAKAEEIKVANRDIKPNNIILVKDQDSHKFIYKFIDFGIGCALHQENVLSFGEYFSDNKDNFISFEELEGMTKKYAAPEILEYETKKKKNESYNPFKADIYSLGVTTLEMMNYCKEEIAFLKENKKITKLKDKDKFEEIVLQMISEDPEKRPSFQEILNFLNNFVMEEPNELDLIDKKNIDKRWIMIEDITLEFSKRECYCWSNFYKAFDKKKSDFVLIEYIKIENQAILEEMFRKNNIIKRIQDLKHPSFAEVLSISDNQDSVNRSFQIIREYGDGIPLFLFKDGFRNKVLSSYFDDSHLTYIVYNMICTLLSGLAKAEEVNIVPNFIYLENIIIIKIYKGKYKVQFLDTSLGYEFKKGDKKIIDNDPYLEQVMKAKYVFLDILTYFSIDNHSPFYQLIDDFYPVQSQDPHFQYFYDLVKKCNPLKTYLDHEIQTTYFEFSLIDSKYVFTNMNPSLFKSITKQYYNLGCYSEAFELCNFILRGDAILNKSKLEYIWYEILAFKVKLKIESSDLQTDGLQIIENLDIIRKNYDGDKDECFRYMAYVSLKLKNLFLAKKYLFLAKKYNDNSLKNSINNKTKLLHLYKISSLICIEECDFTKTMEFNEKAIKIKESLKKNLFKEHLINCLIYMKKMDWKKAKSFNRLALNYKKTNYGEKHYDNSICMNNYSIIYENMGNEQNKRGEKKKQKAIKYAKMEYLIILKYFEKQSAKAKAIESRIKKLKEKSS